MNSQTITKSDQKISDIDSYMSSVGAKARRAAREISAASTETKNRALIVIAESLLETEDFLKSENAKDIAQGRKNGLSQALLDRLELTSERISDMAEGLRQIAALADPVGEITDLKYQPSGIQVGQMRVAFGVIGIIYESRPNVTADAAGLCLKSGNACILRGGSEALLSNLAIASCVHNGLIKAGLSPDAVQVLETTDRNAVGRLITMPEYVDIIVPRGGKGLIERVSNEATVPVIKHLDGICHVYIDRFADKEKSVNIAFNSKTQRYGTCNTMETLLVHQQVAALILPVLGDLFKKEGVELRGCARSCEILKAISPAQDEDWEIEYLAPILSIRVVESFEQAIDHIEAHGSHHTDTIVTENITRARDFIRQVDSSSVMVNASTRFADGFEYGLGAEIGISTDKLHVRGPVGLEGLTTKKYVVFGDGHIRT